MHESVPQLCGGQSSGAPAFSWHRSPATPADWLQFSYRTCSGSAAITQKTVCKSQPRRKNLWGFTPHTRQPQAGQLEEGRAARDLAKDWCCGEPALGHPEKQPGPAALLGNSHAWAPRQAEQQWPAGAAPGREAVA